MPLAFSVWPPAFAQLIAVAPSLKITVPVAVVFPTPVTVAVKVTLWLKFDGFAEELTAVVVAACAIVNCCGTSVAALKLVSPACFAVIVHEPAPVMCTVPGAGVVTVHWPTGVKVTGKLEFAVGFTRKSASPKVWFAIALKPIAWLAFCAVTDSTTVVAGL